MENYVIQNYPGRVAIFQPVENYNGEAPALDRELRNYTQQQSQLNPLAIETTNAPISVV